jgi:lipid A 3-O-deacylase
MKTGLATVLLWLMFLETSAQRNKEGFFRICSENDLFQVRKEAATDRYFTNGLLLEWLGDFGKKLPTYKLLISLKGGKELNGISLGQEMYTPSSIVETKIQKDDRPYAGWLYVGHSLVSTDSERSKKITSSLMLGVMGPLSLAQETQTFVHKLIDSPKPLGWANQIKNDIGINYYTKYEARFIKQLHRNFDLFQAIEGHAGTVTNFIGLGSTLRVGKFNDYFQNASGLFDKNLVLSEARKSVNSQMYSKSSFIQSKQTKTDSTDLIENASNQKTQYYFFISPTLRTVLDNSFLQGGWLNSSTTPYRLSPDQIERFYFNVEYGGVFSSELWGRKFQITFVQAFRTAEFVNGKIQQWGKVDLLIGF